MEPTIHTIQAKILNVLRFRKEARFSELNVEELTNDHFTFHVNRLLSLGFIAKTNGTYTLTDKGKEFVNRLDEEMVAVIKQGKIAVLIVCTDESDGETKYLIQQRFKQPFYGFYWFIGGKARWGETIYQAAERIFLKDSGLKAKMRLVGIEHKIYYTPNNEVREDKYYFIFKTEDAKGKLDLEVAGGKNMWMSLSEIKKLEKRLSGVDTALRYLTNKELTFSESEVRDENY